MYKQELPDDRRRFHLEARISEEIDPIIAMVEGYLHSIASPLEEKALKNKISPQENAQLAYMYRLRYDHFHPIDSLLNGLQSIPEGQIGVDQSRLTQLIDMIPLIRIVEREGLVGINTHISGLLDGLKNQDDPEKLNNTARALDQFLSNAIRVFPHLATGVRVTISEEALRPDAIEAIGKRYGPTVSLIRQQHAEFVERYPQDTGRFLGNSVLVNLPFNFSTGTWGSGERTATSQSEDEISVTSFGSTTNQFEPAIAIAIEKRLVSNPALYKPEEIESICIVTQGEPTPLYAPRHVSGPYISRESAIVHYLKYRGFDNDGEGIYVPSGNLWVMQRREFDELGKLGVSRLIRGFMMLKNFHGAEICLVEIRDLQTAENPLTKKFPKQVKQGIDSDTPEIISHVRYYQGRDIIKRLLEIPAQ